ncbi:chitinase-3-like protein 2 [Condylostylus longicornis]|uniref:chitinase-3-like protein 2 n=1 Tax=Condylostylus longicornis TaxID=2530218 RepID=UPI00244E07D5|nr:chitinase-3-like protein 2 [Condylostylus longicornis]
MSGQNAKYRLLEEQHNPGPSYNWFRLCVLFTICTFSTLAVFTIWNTILNYRDALNVPPKVLELPPWLSQRIDLYTSYIQKMYSSRAHYDFRNFQTSYLNESNMTVKKFDDETIYLSKWGNFIYPDNLKNKKLVCYYSSPSFLSIDPFDNLQIRDVDPFLCTHINVGLVHVVNDRLNITDDIREIFNETRALKIRNHDLKILVWAGGINSRGFAQMVQNHARRKTFIQSLKYTLHDYYLDGVDIDWEFPSAYNKEKQHFSQLLHEIRREYQREHRTYILSVAVAAPEGIAYFAYDIRELQNYCDFVNIMTYDFHFYTKGAPFTGINSPLYARHKERSILATLNINYTVNYWNKNGLNKNKIIIGLPTYGHSYRLVNAFNHEIESPAKGFGLVGRSGFASYPAVCWFKNNNIYVTTKFDTETCSPYMYAGLEWISFENIESIECKTKYILDNNFGGAMVFSLNTDDFSGKYCSKSNFNNKNLSKNSTFPLVRKIRSILFDPILP